MRGMIGGMLTGGLVSVLGLGTVSAISPPPAGLTPPATPLVEAPMVDPVADADVETAQLDSSAPSTPVGAVSIQEPQAPALPGEEAAAQEPQAPASVAVDTAAPRADTDPLDEPVVASIEGSMQAPAAPEGADVIAQPVDPVLPNPQSLAPQTPASEADLTVSTAPAQPTIVIEPESDVVVVEDAPEAPEPESNDQAEAATEEDSFVVDLANTAIDAPSDPAEDTALSTQDIASAIVPSTGPRLQLGGENTLLGNRDTGVTIRRPGSDTAPEAEEGSAPDAAQTPTDALSQYRADAGDVGSKPLMAVVLIDDGSMSSASAALAGLPFGVTIAIDPAQPDAADLMQTYRDNGFEVVVMTKLPDGAQPADVEITFESVFSTFPETIGVLDIGQGGLQSDRDVTEQAMGILAAQGRGFITASKGLNMAGRAADQAGVPAAVVFRDLDSENQDARVVRRFVDQAAFRARQESGVVLVGRVRPDTISALILWGTANSDDQIALVPVSAVLLAE